MAEHLSGAPSAADDRTGSERSIVSDAYQRASSPRIIGAVLIVLGLILWALNSGLELYLPNWWAFFLLIPVIPLWANAWANYQQSGDRRTASVVDPFIGGLVLLSALFVLLLTWDWGAIVPVFMIIVGISALLRASLIRPA